MDYVKETLQRQSAVWLALFGGSEEIDALEMEQESVAKINREPWQSETDPARTALELREEANAAKLITADGVFLGRNADEIREMTQTERELLQRGREKFLRELVFQRQAEQGEEETVRGRSSSRQEKLAAENAGWEAEVSRREGRSNLETADARAISRRFERDARRYDGGFVFY